MLHQAVLTNLAAGKSIAEAATIARIHRATIHRWLRVNPHFRAAFNAWQQEIHDSTRARLLAICDDAVSAVHRAIQKDDARVAMQILRRLGMLRATKPGPSEAADVYLNDRIAKAKLNADYNQKMDQTLIDELMSGVGPKPTAEDENEVAPSVQVTQRRPVPKAGRRALPAPGRAQARLGR